MRAFSCKEGWWLLWDHTCQRQLKEIPLSRSCSGSAFHDISIRKDLVLFKQTSERIEHIKSFPYTQERHSLVLKCSLTSKSPGYASSVISQSPEPLSAIANPNQVMYFSTKSVPQTSFEWLYRCWEREREFNCPNRPKPQTFATPVDIQEDTDTYRFTNSISSHWGFTGWWKLPWR